MLSATPPWFIQVLIGAFIALALPPIGRVFAYLFRRRRKAFLLGVWYCYYHTTEEGKRVMKSEKWTIYRGFRNPVCVRTSSLEPESLEYKGTLTFENGHFLIDLKAQSSFEESVHMRFPYIGAAMTGPNVGVGIQYDYDGNPELCLNVLSRDEISEDEVCEHIRKRIEFPKERYPVRCRV